MVAEKVCYALSQLFVGFGEGLPSSPVSAYFQPTVQALLETVGIVGDRGVGVGVFAWCQGVCNLPLGEEAVRSSMVVAVLFVLCVCVLYWL